MAFQIRGRVKGDKEVIRALHAGPNIFFGHLRGWLIDERRKVLGPKSQSKGYKKILSNKPHRRRGGKWDPRIVGLFKGYIPYAKTVDNLSLRMGVLGKTDHQLKRAMELLQTGGTVTSRKMMPVPIYKNIAATKYVGGTHTGSSRTGLKSAVFESFLSTKRLVPIRVGSRIYFFDNLQRKKRSGRGRGAKGEFLRKGLLFIGLHKIRVRRQLKGRYDLYARFDRMQGAIVKRGQSAVDKATKAVERKK